MEKYILYARKSTDTEDKQVLSIEAQLVELRKFAKDNGLVVIDELIEKRTAKMPGRPVFNSMIKRIENGEANGILAWHPDRLARNRWWANYLFTRSNHTQLFTISSFPI